MKKLTRMNEIERSSPIVSTPGIFCGVKFLSWTAFEVPLTVQLSPSFLHCMMGELRPVLSKVVQFFSLERPSL